MIVTTTTVPFPFSCVSLIFKHGQSSHDDDRKKFKVIMSTATLAFFSSIHFSSNHHSRKTGTSSEISYELSGSYIILSTIYSSKYINKGNYKITELRTILQKESQNS